MSYQVLARKWRPRRFKDMVGQEPILRMLSNALEQKRLHHAYLLTGTRGVGKTTLGRILAKCLNCETGPTPDPCGQCHACQAIDVGQFLDLFEVDAASRTKVEDTRELLDNVLYPPTQGRYKVYLIDEVHMLSNHSFNALLKTLEEPPEHVKFILATTDPKRLPITILSRCLQFHLKRITPEQIAKHLQHICQAETITHDLPALDKLAKAADGSMRDALSLLDQAIAYGHSAVNQHDVCGMLGSMAQDELLPLLEALAAQDGKQLLEKVAHLAELAPDFHQALEELISLFHQIAIAQVVPQAVKQEEAIMSLAKCFAPEDVQLYYQIALLGRRDLAITPSPQQGFEMTMLRMLAFKPTNPSVRGTEQRSNLPPPPPAPTTPAPQAAASPSIPDWRSLLPKLGLTGMAHALASNCILEQIAGNKVILSLSNTHQPMLNQKLKDRLAEALSRQLQQPIQLEINVTSSDLMTPVKQHQQEQEQRLAQATRTMMEDPQVKKLIDMYDGTLEISFVS
ncbi:MAG: DNA polymerase III subunit gamma/tau [Gammaproteobacteria bacterium]|nr:MAG: DNA polymerase III subunit gamma/tau [Gammaproteobacteria bacterium]